MIDQTPKRTNAVFLILSMGAVVAGLPAKAADQPTSQYLDQLESPVFETEGDHQAITRRAIICVSQIVKPGFSDAPTILSSDIEAGVVVANSQFKYHWGMLGMMEETGRTKITVQAKDGRFRILNIDLESIYSGDNPYITPQWQRVGTWKGARGAAQAFTDVAQSIAGKLAECIKAKPADNW